MVNDWKEILSGAYSMWALYLIVIVEASLQALATLSPELAPSGQVQAIAVILLATLGGVGRVIAQPGLEIDDEF